MDFLGLVLITVGVILIGLVRYKWNWYMQNSGVRSIVKILKESGTKIFLVIVGLVLIVLGFPLAVSWWG